MNLAPLVSAIVSNRRQFFALIEALETVAACDIDTIDLEAYIDNEYADRDTISEDDARRVLLLMSRRNGKAAT